MAFQCNSYLCRQIRIFTMHLVHKSRRDTEILFGKMETDLHNEEAKLKREAGQMGAGECDGAISSHHEDRQRLADILKINKQLWLSQDYIKELYPSGTIKSGRHRYRLGQSKSWQWRELSGRIYFLHRSLPASAQLPSLTTLR